MELKDTIDMMCSEDWKERLKAEYLQARIRYEKLVMFINKNRNNEQAVNGLIFLEEQKHHLFLYIRSLERRLKIEKIEIEGTGYVFG